MKPADTLLTGTQHVAVVLMQMSPENAAKVMAQFTDTEAEEIAGEIVKLRKVDPDVAEQIMKDFHQTALTSHAPGPGRPGTRRGPARGVLRLAKGPPDS